MDIQPIGAAGTSAGTGATQKVVPPAGAATAMPQATEILSPAQVVQAVKSINKALQDQSQTLEFTIDSDSNRTIVKVVDQNTKEVLRQIPTEETLEIAKALDQLKGLIIRQKA